jgi:trehalose 6-phosphate phosphatase
MSIPAYSTLAACSRSFSSTLFDAMTACAGPTGMLSEEYDPQAGLSLGNTPQAYSHIAVIEGALALAAANGDPVG